MKKLQKRLRDSACGELALFEVFAFTGCGKKQNINYPANFKDVQI